MAVSEQTPLNSSTGNGVTTVFPYTFKALADADLEVTVDGVVQTLTTDYTVSGAGDNAGGDVTFVVAPIDGATVVRRRAMAYTRSVDYQNQGDLRSSVLNADQDAPVLMIQQIAEVHNRAIRFPVQDSGIDAELPAAADLRDRVMVFDPLTGAPALSAFTATQIASALAAAYSGAAGPLDALSFLQAGIGAVSRSAQDKERERVSLEDFGGSPASTDNYAAFTAAIASGYSPIYLKAETYITSPLTLDSRVKFVCSSGSLGTSVGRKAEIKLKNSAASHLFTFGADAAKLMLENVSLNGNKANQSLANCGIYAPAATAWTESAELVSSHVRNCKGNGIQLGQNRNRLHLLLRSYVAENDGYGVYSVGAMDHKFDASEIGDNGLSNCFIDGDVVVQAANMVFTNTEMYHGGLLGTSEGYNLHIGGRCSEVTWLGGDCLRAQRHGVRIDQLLLATPSSVSIHGVRMSANSWEATNTYSDIYDDRGGTTFVALKHVPTGGVVPKYLYEIGPNSIRSTSALGALYTASSYGTGFSSNSSKMVALDDQRGRFPADHPGLTFSNTDLAGNIVLTAINQPTGQATFTIGANGTVFWGSGSGAVDTALLRQQADLLSVGATDSFNARTALWLTDGVATEFAQAGFAKIFVDSADGDLKVRFGDGTLKTIVLDT